jgi:hypothetical protein
VTGTGGVSGLSRSWFLLEGRRLRVTQSVAPWISGMPASDDVESPTMLEVEHIRAGSDWR